MDMQAQPQVVLEHTVPAKRVHAYELGTDKGKILVRIDSRAAARALAEQEGYVVRDVNMIG